MRQERIWVLVRATNERSVRSRSDMSGAQVLQATTSFSLSPSASTSSCHILRFLVPPIDVHLMLPHPPNPPRPHHPN